MAHNMNPDGNLNVMSDIPTTISPPSLLMSSSSTYVPSQSSDPIHSPPIPYTTTTPAPAPSSVSSRPPKRHVRPRATTDEEKRVRLEQRKLANRTAAKQSRERQKQAIEKAREENERLKQENSQLVARLANLEQRMQAIESTNCMDQILKQEEGIISTHQPARPMKTPEQQCPMIPLSVNSPQPRPVHFPPHSTLTLQARVLVAALQILIHSFTLLNFRMPLNQLLMTLRFSRQLRLHQYNKTLRYSSQWLNPLHGYATPNLEDLSGAIRRSAFIHRGNNKSLALTRHQRMGKDWLRMVRRHERRRGKENFIRLIIKKKHGKHMTM
jgi:bZIP Maf transcription factor